MIRPHFIRDEVISRLDRLSWTYQDFDADDVASVLEAMGIRGFPLDNENCPLANYLNGQCSGLSNMGATVDTDTCTVDGVEVDLPEPYPTFLRRLAAGIYPELCEKIHGHCLKCGRVKFRFTVSPGHANGKYVCCGCGRDYGPKPARRRHRVLIAH